MARRLLNLYKSTKFHRHPLPLFSSSDKICAVSFSSKNIFADGQQTKDTATKSTPAEDRLRKFIDPKVQHLLKELTGLRYETVFRKRKVGQKVTEPTYTFMTEKQLVESLEDAKTKAVKILQMPPVLQPRKPIKKVLSWDPYLQGLERNGVNLLFTDITPNRTDRTRIIVVREPDGTLREATWEERDKCNEIYFPVPGREIKVPKVFSNPDLLQEALKRVEKDPTDNVYEHICDRACIQFEPDHPFYIQAVEAVYNKIDELQHYDYLTSTRHYGPMVFHYVRLNKIDNLLSFYIKQERIPSASNLVSLFHLIFPECKSVKKQGTNDQEKISNYIQLDAVQKTELTLIFNVYLENEKAKADLQTGLQRSHGAQ